MTKPVGIAGASIAATLFVTRCSLAQTSPTSEWQRDLSISHNNLGYIASTAGDPLPPAPITRQAGAACRNQTDDLLITRGITAALTPIVRSRQCRALVAVRTKCGVR